MDFLKPPPGHPHYQPEPVPEETMSTSAASEQYKTLRAKIAAAKKQMEDTAKGLFTEMSKELFDANPALLSFSWTQYTPYYCDGETCTFRCNGEYPQVAMFVDEKVMQYDSNSGNLTINGREVKTQEQYQRMFQGMRGGAVSAIVEDGATLAYDPTTKLVTRNGEKIKTHEEYHALFGSLEKTVSAFMRNFEDEDMQVMFGDHVEIACNRDGTIQIEEYGHE